jgi:HPt (histidine-containing phosphotransfer) domain-containing protein
MAELRTRFIARLAAEKVLLLTGAREGDRASLRAVCHRIAGAAGMFGYAALSASASQVEEAIDAGVSDYALSPLIDALLIDADHSVR